MENASIAAIRPTRQDGLSSGAIRNIEGALNTALGGDPEGGAMEIARHLGPDLALAIFMAADASSFPEDAVLLGNKYGTLMMEGSVDLYDGTDLAVLRLSSAYSHSNTPLLIEAVKEVDGEHDEMSDRLDRFFLQLEIALQDTNVAVSRAVPFYLAANQRDDFTVKSGRPFSPGSKVAALGVIGAMLLLSALFWSPSHARKSPLLPPDPSQLAIQAPAPQPRTVPAGIGGVSVQVGGHGAGSSNLAAFGIKAGPEVSTDSQN